MLILAVDTSCIACSAAVVDENKLHGEFFTDYKLKHSEKLMPLVDSLLKTLRMSINDIDVFACVNGPGSFTGLRIGAATIKGFAQALDKPVVCVSTLETMAEGQMPSEIQICPILDAQRDQVYTAVYEPSNQGFSNILTECAIGIDELIGRLKEGGAKKTLFCADAVIKYREHIISEYPNAVFASNANMCTHASWAGMLAIKKATEGKTLTYSQVDINYIRESQAQVNYKTQL